MTTQYTIMESCDPDWWFVFRRTPSGKKEFLYVDGTWHDQLSVEYSYYNSLKEAQMIADKYCNPKPITSVGIGDKVRVIGDSAKYSIHNKVVGRVTFTLSDNYIVKIILPGDKWAILTNVGENDYHVIVRMEDLEVVKNTTTIGLSNGKTFEIQEDDPYLSKLQKIINDGEFWFCDKDSNTITYIYDFVVDDIEVNTCQHILTISRTHCSPWKIRRIYNSFEEAKQHI